MAMERAAIIACNWKMNLGPKEASKFVLEILPSLGQITAKDPHIMSVLCPPAISLAAIKEVLDSIPTRRVKLGAQNMYFEEKGAFTGEIAPGMVKEFCNFVILGHSERRTIFGETDELVNKKVLAAFKHALVPIVCVGENSEQHGNGETQSIIKDQICQGLANLTTEQAARVVIAYEPVWAIGSGKASDTHTAGNVIHYIRHLYHEIYGQKAADAVHILYGGSVNAENIADFIAHPDIDGALVGGASIKHDFIELLRNASKFKA